MAEQDNKVKVKLEKRKNANIYRHSKRNRVVVFYNTELEDQTHTLISFKRLVEIDDIEKRKAMLAKGTNGPEVYYEGREHSKYVIVTTILQLLHVSLECLHHGITWRLEQLDKKVKEEE